MILTGIALGLLPLGTGLLVPEDRNLLFSISLVFLGAVILFLLQYSNYRDPLRSLSVYLFGALYIGLCSCLTAMIRDMPHGRLWIIFLLAVVASADTGAYLIGNAMGRYKLCPAISSGKTVEGAIGGLFACALAAILSWISFLGFLDLRVLVPLAVLLGVASQLGDLTESLIKRACNQKDSGKLLPGHGGVFDRVDALLLAGPVLYWVLYFGEDNLMLR